MMLDSLQFAPSAIGTLGLTSYLSLVLHEIGHAEAVIALGGKVRAVVVTGHSTVRKKGLSARKGLCLKKVRPYPIYLGLPARGRAYLDVEGLRPRDRAIVAAAGPVPVLLVFAIMAAVAQASLNHLPSFFMLGVTVMLWHATFAAAADLQWPRGSDAWHFWQGVKGQPFPTVPVKIDKGARLMCNLFAGLISLVSCVGALYLFSNQEVLWMIW